MAVQGGLLAATIASREEEKLKEEAKGGHAFPIVAFLTSKLVAYTILGALLGWLGSFFQLSISFKVILQIAISIFMLGTAFNILELHPIFRYFVIQPPRFLTRMIRKESKSKDVFAPAILGSLTIFIPCGTTQAMMALAVASANPLLGAAVLFAFILGTSPVFFILGYFATRLADKFQKTFMKIAAVAIILLAFFNLNNAAVLTGSSLSIGDLAKAFWCAASSCNSSAAPVTTEAAVEDATISIRSLGYEPNSITVKAGSKVTLHLDNVDGTSCVQAFTIPQLNYQKVIPVGQKDTITFTAPQNKGQIAFMCSMGMFRGVINVI